MASSAFAKLFPNRKNRKGTENGDKRCCPDNSMLSVDRVRLLVFKDHDLKGREVVFDSEAKMCRPTPPQPPPKNTKTSKPDTNQADNPRSVYRNSQGVRPGSDVKLLGEMMFGALPMFNKTTSFKVHLTRSPARLMITKVFVPSHQVPVEYISSLTSSVSSTATVSDVAATVGTTTRCASVDITSSCSAPVSLEHQSYDVYKIHSIPSDEYSDAPAVRSMPPLSEASTAINISIQQKSPSNCGLASSVPTSTSADAGLMDSGEDYRLSESGALSLTSSLNLSTSPAVFDMLTTSSGPASINLPIGNTPATLFDNRERRLKRHRTTQLEGNLKLLQLLSENNAANSLPLHKRPTKIGLGVVFTLSDINSAETKNFQNFIFSHMMLIENYLLKLKISVDDALIASNSSEVICEAMDTFLHSIRSLHTAGRLPSPVWLSLVTQNSAQFRVGVKFLTDFMWLVDKCNTKCSRFFLSSVITAVLTHHLSWVSTVSPAGDSPSKAYLNKHMPSWLYSLARSHPYNPLWAQLGDLCGAIGFPLRIARTTVIGQKPELVLKLLNVLSYFIRCSDIIESNELQINVDCYRNGATDKVTSQGDSAQSSTSGASKPPMSPALHRVPLETGNQHKVPLESCNQNKVPLESGNQNKDGETTELSDELDSVGINNFVDAVRTQLSEAMLPKTGLMLFKQETPRDRSPERTVEEESCGEALQIYEEEPQGSLESFQIGCDRTSGIEPGDWCGEDKSDDINLCQLAKYQIIEESRIERETPVRTEVLHASRRSTFQSSYVEQKLVMMDKHNSSSLIKSYNSRATDCDTGSVESQPMDHSAAVSHSSSQLELQSVGYQAEDLNKLSMTQSLCDISEWSGNTAGTMLRMAGNDILSPRNNLGGVTTTSDAESGTSLQRQSFGSQSETLEVECTGILSKHRMPMCQRIYPDLSMVHGDMSEISPSLVSSLLAPREESVTVGVPYIRISPSKSETSESSTLNTNDICASLHSNLVNSKDVNPCAEQIELTVVKDLNNSNRTPANTVCSSSAMTLNVTLGLDSVADSSPTGRSVGDGVRGTASPAGQDIECDSGVESIETPRFTSPVSNTHSNRIYRTQPSANNIDEYLRQNQPIFNKSDVLADNLLRQNCPAPSFTGLQRGISIFDDLYDNPTLDLPNLIKSSVAERSADYSVNSSNNDSLNVDSELYLDLTDSYGFQSEHSDYSVEDTYHNKQGKYPCGNSAKVNDWACSEFDVEDDSGVSSEHFSSVSIEVRKMQQQPDFIDQLPMSESASQLRSTMLLVKDVMNQRRRRHSSGQSQTSSVNCRSASPTDFGNVGGLCRCTSVTSNTTDCQESSCPTAFKHFTELPLVLRDAAVDSSDLDEELALMGKESFVTVTGTASTAAAAAASAAAAAAAAGRHAAAGGTRGKAAKAGLGARISYDYNFGRSLMAGFCGHYMSDFILHGTRDRSVLSSPYTQIHTDLKASVQNSIVDDPVAEASCIVADVDKWVVKLFSCKYNSSDELSVQQLTSSQLVCDCVEAVHDLWKLKVSPEFCIVHLEDRLQQIYLKSKILAEFIKVHRRLYSKELAALHGFDMSDMPLLLAVVGTHSPDVILSLMEDQL